jgi:DNA (cytosine-5)-methyltransferase 1
MKAVELFSGAGGLGMGVTLAGFKPMAVVEWDRWACDTIRENKARSFPLVRDWPLVEGDVKAWIEGFSATDVDLVAGGPPCQPFSMGGKHRAHRDNRDMFPVTVEVVRKLRPKAFIVENVKGLTRSAFANYFNHILLQFEFPELQRRPDESWVEHFHRLQRERSSGKHRRRHGSLTYNVNHELVNAADFGIPQRRERVFIVGFRSDLGVEWDFPTETHSLDALLFDQWVSGEYWDRHSISLRKRPVLSGAMKERVARLRGLRLAPTRLPWRTTRDALIALPDPRRSSGIFTNHKFQPGAKPYPGHTGSPLDLPAKTLKAGDHGVPGGENMMVTDSGAVRYFTVRESARLQTFPDGYIFHGAWSETMRQLGNAVPVALAHLVAASVAEKLVESEERRLRFELAAKPQLA